IARSLSESAPTSSATYRMGAASFSACRAVLNRRLSIGSRGQGTAGRPADQRTHLPRINQGDIIYREPTCELCGPNYCSVHSILYAPISETWGLRMRRREFIAGLGAAAWPL